MLPFKQFYRLNESRFRDRKDHIHLMDVPMFSIFIDKQLAQTNADQIDSYKNSLQEACKEARNRIAKMGFSSMHSNIVIRDLSKEVNQNTGGDVGGRAYSKGKYMAIGADMIKNADYLIKLIVHEWAHLWMFNNSKAFKKAVKEYYDLIRDYSIESYTTPPDAYDYLNADYPFIDRDGYSDKLVDDTFTYIVDNIWRYISNVYHSLYTMSYPDPDFDPDGYWRESSEKQYAERESYLVKTLEEIITEGSVIIDSSLKNEMYKYKKFINKVAVYYAPLLLPHVDKKISYDNSDIKWDIEEHPEMSLYDVAYMGDRDRYQANGQKIESYRKRYDLVFDVFVSPDVVALLLNLIHHVLKMTKREETDSYKNFSGKSKQYIRDVAKDLVKWSDSYGMSNDDELWATGVEDFLKLPKYHRQKIIQLMYK